MAGSALTSLLAAVAALAGAPATVAGAVETTGARPEIVTFGGETTVTGVTSRTDEGAGIVVRARECGRAAFAVAGAAAVGRDGEWSYAARPSVTTVFRVDGGERVVVRVRPRLVLRRLAPGLFRVEIRAARSFRGKRLRFERYDRGARRWRPVAAVRVRGRADTASAVVSRADFASAVPTEETVRVLLPARQARPCYLVAASNTVTS